MLAKNVTVLLVEDEEFLREFIVIMLATWGFESSCVHQASNFNDGKKILVSTSIDLLITDCNMPGEGTGIHLMEIAQRTNPKVRLIVMSGKLDENLRIHKQIVDGLKKFSAMPKPFNIDILTATLEKEGIELPPLPFPKQLGYA